MPPEPFYERKGLAELKWPRDLPPPPAAANLTSCNAVTGDRCLYMLGTRHAPAAERLRAALHQGDRFRYVLIDGERFMVAVDPLYPGERTIKALSLCSAYLAKQGR